MRSVKIGRIISLFEDNFVLCFEVVNEKNFAIKKFIIKKEAF